MQLVTFSRILLTHDILSDSQKDIGSKSWRPPSSDSLIRTENLTFAGLLFHKKLQTYSFFRLNKNVMSGFSGSEVNR